MDLEKRPNYQQLKRHQNGSLWPFIMMETELEMRLIRKLN